MKCLNPIKLHNAGGEVVDVPCGHCINCKKERSKQWAFRLMCEYKEWNCSVFVTLTFDTPFLTLVPDAEPPYYATISPRDITLFIKRLRKNLGGRKIKYYACGEYGSTTYRPHYHLIIFGVDFSDTPVIEKSWSQGFVKVEDVNIATVSYVSGYVQKKLYGSDSYPDLIYPPFSRMSKNLGAKYFIDNASKIWEKGITFQGFNINVPRYFYKLIESGKIKNYSDFDVLLKKSISRSDVEAKNELALSRRFGYMENSDDKELFVIEKNRVERASAIARELLLKSRSKI
jgi:hypothetical protein